MPYFPTREETAYKCRGCGQWFIPSGQSCCVMHPPGTCCHAYETAIGDPMPATTRTESPYDLSAGRKGFRR